MKEKVKKLGVAFLVLFLPVAVWAGFQGYSGNTNLGQFTGVICSTGLTCTKSGGNLNVVSAPALSAATGSFTSTLHAGGNFDINTSKFTVAAASGNTHVLGDFDINTSSFTVAASSGNTVVGGTFVSTGALTASSTANVVGNFSVATNKFNVTASNGNTTVAGTLGVTGATTFTGGVALGAGSRSNFMNWHPPTLTSGTSTTPASTVVYMSQVWIPTNATLTGVYVNNGATVGTNKYVAALFNASGSPLANSSLSGVTTSGGDAYQQLPFTGTVSVTGPATYWIGLYVNGTTDRFRSVPAVGQWAGLHGSVSGQTFGTVASVTPPSSFSADLGPVAFTY